MSQRGRRHRRQRGQMSIFGLRQQTLLARHPLAVEPGSDVRTLVMGNVGLAFEQIGNQRDDLASVSERRTVGIRGMEQRTRPERNTTWHQSIAVSNKQCNECTWLYHGFSSNLP